ncbi:MAG: ATP phosphoribosyltransferase regulatory subunit [Zhaonellaceae bacterium]|nr:ATP phosphoribosyltransferase regulatory subunit [Clostridia bacterium]
MNKFSTRLQTVNGVKDILPKEAFEKRKLEASLVELFRKWGYQEVQPPTIEYYDVVAENDNSIDELFKFIDREGRILALRPDFTTPIARLVAANFKGETLPLRLFYTGNVFRFESTQTGRQREFSQAGVELIGAKGVGADAEVIALAIEAMLACSLKDFKIGIGQVMVTKGLLEEFSQEPADIQTIKQAIITKDFVGLENILLNQKWDGKPRKELLGLATLHGSIEVLSKARKLSNNDGFLQAIEELEQVYDILESYGLSKYIFFDFSILRDFEYYTGIVFEGYTPDLGYPVCGGGRYDNLLSRFGLEKPAVGFALGQERVMLAQKSFSCPPKIDYLVTGGDTKTLLKKAKELRAQGYSAIVDFDGSSAVQVKDNINEVLFVQGGKS